MNLHPHAKLEKKYSLLAHNTFHLDIKTDYFFSYDSEEALCHHLPELRDLGLPILSVGEGSNLLFLSDFTGIVLCSAIKSCEVIAQEGDDVLVRAGSGMVWDDFVAWAVGAGYGGLENLSAIPGTVGAAPVQNVGAYGVEACDLIHQVEAIEIATGEKRIFNNTDCAFGYRDSIFKHELKGKYIVSHVTFNLSKKPTFILQYGNLKAFLGDKVPSLSIVREVVIAVRAEKLPDHRELGNAGSFFTNPFITEQQHRDLLEKYPKMPSYPVDGGMVKVAAGWLIEHAGLKGFCHKGAAVHKNQALVLVNTGDAIGQDIAELAEIVAEKVNDVFGICLHPEVNFIQA